MAKDLKERIFDVFDPGRKVRDVFEFEQPGTVTINVDKALKRQRDSAVEKGDMRTPDHEREICAE